MILTLTKPIPFITELVELGLRNGEHKYSIADGIGRFVSIFIPSNTNQYLKFNIGTETIKQVKCDVSSCRW